MAAKATQIIPGVLRETSNPLLLKADIGKPSKCGYKLPDSNFTYGKINQRNGIGTVDVLGSWQTHLKGSSNDTYYFSQKDFIKMNKSAIHLGLITAKDFSNYQLNNECFKKKVHHSARNKISLPPDVVFGVPTKASLPINIFEHKEYGYTQEEQQLHLAKLCNDRKSEISKRHKGYSETRTSFLRRHKPSVDPPPLWQMSKFQKNALPALDTFRNEAAREKAFQKHRTDSIARTGLFGHGTYKGA
ncbi:cilia- and flagella-associated protein 77 isoform X1 [Hydra vulgaris]|uniref:Cilia- and flagella-associated protein 77 isoform X1 n=1 Tax=Hydra vulgaris TaxID=6087 RepID=A0ABM4BE03_HYDVU